MKYRILKKYTGEGVFYYPQELRTTIFNIGKWKYFKDKSWEYPGTSFQTEDGAILFIKHKKEITKNLKKADVIIEEGWL